MKKNQQWTALQRAVFFSGIVSAAKLLGEHPEAYRRRIMKEELGIDHLSGATKTTGFDRLMQRVWVDRGDYARALDYSGGDVKRLRYLAMSAAMTIVGSDETAACRYVAGIFSQMKLVQMAADTLAMKLQRADGWDDFTEMQIKKVISALHIQMTRAARKASCSVV